MDRRLLAGKLRHLRARRERLLRVSAKIRDNLSGHISDHDLERYHLGQIVEETELAAVEEHLLACPGCADRAQATADYVDAMRRAAIEGDHDL